MWRWIRWFVLSVAGGLSLAIAGGVFGEFFIEWARESNWYINPSERVDALMNAFSSFVTQPWFINATMLIAGFAIGVWTDAFVRRRETLTGLSVGADREQIAKIVTDGAEPHGLSTARQIRLRDLLKDHAGSNAEISFANITHKPLAETIASVFELAGWETNLNNVPIEQYHKGTYIEGIEVRAFNKHLLDFVCEALEEHGLSVRRDLRSTEIKRDNPKWPWVQRNIKITIGHH